MFKKTKYLILALFLIPDFVFTQNKKIDSLKLVISSVNQDTSKLKALNLIAIEFHKFQLDSSLFYYNTSYNLTKKILVKYSTSSNDIKKIKFIFCNCLIGMGSIYLEKGDVDNALKKFNQCLIISKQFNYKDITADLYENIGHVFKYIGNKEEEYKNIIKALNIREEINNKLGVANSLHNLGHYYREKGDILKAIQYHEKSIIIFEKLDDTEGVTMSLSCIGDFYFNKGDNSLALKYYNKCFEYCQNKKFKIGISRSYQNIGNIYYEQGNIIKAFDYFNKYLEIARESNNQREISLALLNLSEFYLLQGKISQSIVYYLQVLNIYERIGDKKDIIDLYNYIGSIYLDQDSVSKASTYFVKALKISEKINYKIGVIAYYVITGDIYRDQNNYVQALKNYEKGLIIADELINKDQVAELYLNIGEMHHKLFNTKIALDFYNKSLNIYFDYDNKRGIVNSLINIGKLFYTQKKYHKAIEYLNKSMPIAKEIASPEIILEIAEELNKVYFEMGNYKESLTNYKLYIKMRDSLNNIEDQKTLVRQESQSEFDKQQALEKGKHDAELLIQKEKADVDKKKQQVIIFSVSLVLILVGFFSFLLYRRYKTTQLQKKIITEQKQEVEKQKEVVEEQNHLIKEKQKEILDSINYAKRLQEAILPPLKFIDEYVHNNFVLYQPKDVVAGDFYWAETKDNKFFIAAADCTGHGVPGAMVSVVCSNALNRTVNEFDITDTGKILDKTRELVLETFAKGNSEVKDGMDISLLCIDKQINKAFWSGANNPLWYLKQLDTESNSSGTEALEVPVKTVTSSEVEKSTSSGLDSARPDIQLIEIKADKQPIGKSDYAKPFTTHEIALQEGMLFYLFTDGFADQFGGPKGKKFKYKQLEEILIVNANKNMSDQHEILSQQFALWKGDLEQVDDVCVIGVTI